MLNNKDNWFVLFVLCAILAVTITLGLWVTLYAPCSWYEGASVKDVPFRCIKEWKEKL